MPSYLHCDFHTHGPTATERGTSVEVHAQADCVVIRIGDGGTLPPLAIYVDRAAEAFALAKAFAAAGQVIEQRAGKSRADETPAEPLYTNVPLPLGDYAQAIVDESQLCGWRSAECRTLGCRSEKCPAF